MSKKNPAPKTETETKTEITEPETEGTVTMTDEEAEIAALEAEVKELEAKMDNGDDEGGDADGEGGTEPPAEDGAATTTKKKTGGRKKTAPKVKPSDELKADYDAARVLWDASVERFEAEGYTIDIFMQGNKTRDTKTFTGRIRNEGNSLGVRSPRLSIWKAKKGKDQLGSEYQCNVEFHSAHNDLVSEDMTTNVGPETTYKGFPYVIYYYKPEHLDAVIEAVNKVYEEEIARIAAEEVAKAKKAEEEPPVADPEATEPEEITEEAPVEE